MSRISTIYTSAERPAVVRGPDKCLQIILNMFSFQIIRQQQSRRVDIILLTAPDADVTYHDRSSYVVSGGVNWHAVEQGIAYTP